ncbi:MAG TPA: methyltransferase domain-containing protein [Bryobacteraceae bacterium]|nr:methyltransferase domain-containing protein [Bryobacteraceae bacterium]
MPHKRNWLLDSAALFLLACILIAPLFRLEYLNNWPSIESTWISDSRMLQEHLPHPGWQPLWYCGNRFDYLYPLALRYAPALISKLAGVSTARAYHFYVGILYAFGIVAVYLLARTGSGSRRNGLLAAALAALVSPCFLLIRIIRYDAPFWQPQRLHVLMAYGEGPHISSLSIVLAALAATFAALRKGSPVWMGIAGLLAALAVTHNFYGATSLAIFFSLVLWVAWLAHPGKAVILRAAAIAALAYGLCAFWLTPSFLELTLRNLHWVSEPTSRPWRIATGVAMLAFFALSYRYARRRPEATWLVFVIGSVTLLSFYVLPYFYFNQAVVANPGRLLPELDLAYIFLFALIVTRMWSTRRLRAVAAALAVIAFLPSLRYLAHAWEPFPAVGPLDGQYEYRITKWVHDNLPHARVMATGTLRYWFDGWFDNAQTDGLSLQGMENQILPHATWQLAAGGRADLAKLWLQALGTDAVIVPDKTSPEHYHDFQKPEKFRGAFAPLYDDHAGTVIYAVPRCAPGIGRLVREDILAGIGPIRAGDDLETLTQYVAAVEDCSRPPVQVTWQGADAFTVHANVPSGDAVLVQETYDPAWHAAADGRAIPVRRDPVMGFMTLEVPAGAQRVELRFVTPLENRIGGAVTLGSCIALVLLLAYPMTARFGSWAVGRETVMRLPWHLRLARMALRRINYHLSPARAEPAAEPFDPVRLKQSAEALRAMPMPDAGSASYLAKHVPRLARTLALVPPPQKTGRVLELGCYMQITPLLERFCGYGEVRGAYYGRAGRTDRKTMQFADREFSCSVDHFDAERDRFPYPEGHYDLVIAAEIIEHLTYDPMHMLLESRRVLAEGGYLLVTTPNVGSVTSVAKTLDGHDNPQIFFLYERPEGGRQTDIGHVREYTVYELGEAVKAAGFEVVQLFTTFIEEYASHRPLLQFLAENGYDPENRGEQSWCLAVKRASLPIDRYPYFIYSP